MPDDHSVSEGRSFNLSGVRLYPPGLIAAYTVLFNLPLGLILYGLNIMARGRRSYGKIVVGSGVLTGIYLLLLMFRPRIPERSRMLFVISLLCALSIFKLESGAYERAVATGASRAKWWPPLLIVVGIVAVILGIQVLLGQHL
jgi:hypothetical protein